MSSPKLISFIESEYNRTVFINPNKVLSVFRIDDGDHAGKTVINLNNHGFFTEQDELEIVNLINGALNE